MPDSSQTFERCRLSDFLSSRSRKMSPTMADDDKTAFPIDNNPYFRGVISKHTRSSPRTSRRRPCRRASPSSSGPFSWAARAVGGHPQRVDGKRAAEDGDRRGHPCPEGLARLVGRPCRPVRNNAARHGLPARVGSLDEMGRLTAAWEADRNARARTIEWRLAVDDARERLVRPYSKKRKNRS